MAGVDLPTLKELMGHSTITMTMRYVHPTPEHKLEAVRKLEQFDAEQLFALYEQRGPRKSPHSRQPIEKQCTAKLLTANARRDA